jgi:hypothetical protein
MKTTAFKSERAAKMAYTKSDKAYEEARSAVNRQRNEFNKDGWNEERFAIVRALEAKAEESRLASKAVYDQATAQGFWIDSYHFGTNPTRDLIAANMD